MIAVVLVLATGTTARAASDAVPGDAPPPAREGNIYDHKDHQPTEADVQAAEKAAGVKSPGSPGRQQVQDEVKKLLDQTDALDRQSEKNGRE